MIWQLIDFNKLVVQLLPTFFNKSRFLALFKAVVKPLQTLADVTLYQMQHDSRVIYLEKVLNEYFEVIGYDISNHIATRTIYIEDADGIEYDWVFNSNEAAEDLIVYNSTEPETQWIDVTPGNYYHFIVKIPVAIVFDELKTRALIDFYKLAGKKYIIQTY